MKIKDLKHAIKLTIKRHQAVLDGKYSNYDEAKLKMQPKGWTFSCPLCEYDYRTNISLACCENCPWVTFTGQWCLHPQNAFSINDNKRSIKRLRKWLKMLEEKESHNKEKGLKNA